MSAPRFGTSGLRGLVSTLTDPLCAGYTAAFLASAKSDGTVLIGRDLRASSPRIVAAVAGAARARGLAPLDCGVLPTPALALAAMERGTSAIMVTGSHIPDDRNGIKFYTPDGEITKADEAAISAGYAPSDAAPARAEPDTGPLADYRARYGAFFGPHALHGLRIGVYEHSSAAREVLGAILSDLGAAVTPLGRADRFVPVDTEAVDDATRGMLAGWAAEHALDAIVSTDGDADRPMVTDAGGQVIPGDVLGPLTGRAIGAEVLVTPVSSNTLVDLMGEFRVHRTRIGSPYVIEGMAAEAPAAVAGYEANGGFLTGFTARRSGRMLPPLPTRDSILPILAPLALTRAGGTGLAELAATLPPRFTAADRLTGVPPEVARAFLQALDARPSAVGAHLGEEVDIARIDRTDGFRATLGDGRIVHFRPSGNAPEFRIYVEAGDGDAARAALAALLGSLARAFCPG